MMSAQVPKHRSRQQRGQVVIMFALVLSFVLFSMTVLIIDLTALYVQESYMVDAAQTAARDGAADANTAAYISTGTLKLAGGATGVCHTAGESALSTDTNGGHTATITCSASGVEVTATISEQVALPMDAFGITPHVSATEKAGLVAGTITPN